MNTKIWSWEKCWLSSIRLSGFTMTLFGIFWGVWSMFAPVPVFKPIAIVLNQISYSSLELSHWYDVLFIGLYTILLTILYGRMKERTLFIFALIFGVIAGLLSAFLFIPILKLGYAVAFAFFFGTVFEFVIEPAYGPGYGFVTGLGYALAFGFVFGPIVALAFGLVFSLVIVLSCGFGYIAKNIKPLFAWLCAKEIE
jgi:hypothetical protein